MGEGRPESVGTPEANRFFFAWRKLPRNSAHLQRDSFLRFAVSAKGALPPGICHCVQIVGKHYRLSGGAEWIRTSGAIRTMYGIQPQFERTSRPREFVRLGFCCFDSPGFAQFDRLKADARRPRTWSAAGRMHAQVAGDS
jgi:hypothetical protein